MDLTDIYTVFLSTVTEYIFSLAAHGMFSEKDNILKHKVAL
jgi:hypothetical protein